jgi:hypothetical protein
MERAVKIAGAAVLAALAVVAALLAGDVRSVPTAFTQGDATYGVTPHRATWRPATRLGGTASSLLGVRDDLAFRRALRLYRIVQSTPNRLDTAVELQTLRSQAETALSASARGGHASQADTLLGILAFGESATGTGSNAADAAISDFSNAVRADPANAAAKFDLELMLRLTVAQGSRSGTGPGGSFGRGGRRGAGGGVPGTGY